jgi:hypothetical protein
MAIFNEISVKRTSGILLRRRPVPLLRLPVAV